MKTSRANTCKLGVAIACLLLGAVAPNLRAQGVQYTRPNDNAQQAPPYRTVPHYYTAKSSAMQNVSTAQLTCPPDTQRYQGHCIVVPSRPGHAHAQTHTAPATSSGKWDLRANRETKSDTHRIIFVGGKQALNPQPIPPGHAIKRLPHTGAPIEADGH